MKAQQMKDDLKDKESRVFSNGSKWQPQVTSPQTPKLSYVTAVSKSKKAEKDPK